MHLALLATLVFVSVYLIVIIIAMVVTGHKHEYEQVDRVDVYTNGGYPSKFIYVMKCKTCGKIKKVTVRC